MNAYNETPDRELCILTELGLTAPQAKIYLALTKAKSLDAQTISINSGVARPDVYRVLTQLERDGFVATVIDEPKRFQAIPTNECLSILLQKKEQKVAQLKRDAKSFFMDSKLTEKEEKDYCKPEFVFIPNKEALFNKTKKLVTEATDSICLLGKRKMLFWCITSSQMLKQAIARKVTVKLIIDLYDENPQILKSLKSFEQCPTFSLKLLREPMKASFGIYDKKQIVIGTADEDLANKYPCLWSDNKPVVQLTQDYFEIMWQNAEPYHF